MPWLYGVKVWGLFANSNGYASVYLMGENIPNKVHWYGINAEHSNGVTDIFIACSKARAADSYVDVELDGNSEVITIYAW